MAGHQHAFSLLVMGRPMSAEEAREAGFVNAVVAPGHAIIEAQKVAREINELPPQAVAISRKLLKLPTEDLLRRMEEEEHLLSERIHAPTVLAAVKGFVQRRKR
jgi:enoyl-CoA hydratase/carnithine racemase